MPNEEFNENKLTESRREKIVSVVKAKISKSKDKVKKAKNRFLREAFKELSKNPDKKAVAAGKAIKTKLDAAQKMSIEASKKIHKLCGDTAKKKEAAKKEVCKKIDTLQKELSKKQKAFDKELQTKCKLINKPVDKKVDLINKEQVKVKEKLTKMGYTLELENPKFVRPLFRTDDNGKKELGGALAEPIREEARAKCEALDEIADDCEVTTHIDGTALNDKMKEALAEVNDIVMDGQE